MFVIFPFFIIKEEFYLPRIARKDLGSPFLHIMVQGVNKEYIFSNREIVKKLILFLNEKCNIKYVEIKNYFEISRCVMTTLKKQ